MKRKCIQSQNAMPENAHGLGMRPFNSLLLVHEYDCLSVSHIIVIEYQMQG